ncbi:response regulator [Arthrobacter cryoconiti]|uniref:Response regulator n=1 Tax=Arthrobacter cryoconiti TaxID=748907 RepID=A0ABV8QZ34_9MICC|nr:response regulator transcription factor [Arthrobacter cryoconiti]MCC9068209.1 response regulator transcription factor [Arthrobacter cryoconiti]
MIRVLIADDNPLARAGLGAILSLEPGIDVVGSAEHGGEVVPLARAVHPDVVCMDITLPGRDPMSIVAELSAQDTSGSVPVLVLSTFDVDEHVFSALEAGASGFLLKSAEPRIIVEALRHVAAGEGVIDQALTGRVLREFSLRRALQPVVVSGSHGLLSGRELQIVQLLAEGLSNAEIAVRLFLEVSTVKSHLGRIMAKIGVGSRLQAVVWAYQSGIVEFTRDSFRVSALN